MFSLITQDVLNKIKHCSGPFSSWEMILKKKEKQKQQKATVYDICLMKF